MADSFEWAKPEEPTRRATTARDAAISAAREAWIKWSLDHEVTEIAPQTLIELIVDAVTPLILIDARITIEDLSKQITEVLDRPST